MFQYLRWYRIFIKPTNISNLFSPQFIHHCLLLLESCLLFLCDPDTCGSAWLIRRSKFLRRSLKPPFLIFCTADHINPPCAGSQLCFIDCGARGRNQLLCIYCICQDNLFLPRNRIKYSWQFVWELTVVAWQRVFEYFSSIGSLSHFLLRQMNPKYIEMSWRAKSQWQLELRQSQHAVCSLWNGNISIISCDLQPISQASQPNS